MIAIAADRPHPQADDARPDRTGSLRRIGDILGELLAGYELVESASPAAAAARESEPALSE